MVSFYYLLLGWLPLSLRFLALGIMTIVVLLVLVRLVALILDLIPFL